MQMKEALSEHKLQIVKSDYVRQNYCYLHSYIKDTSTTGSSLKTLVL